MYKFVLATNNKKKLAELSRILEPLSIEAVTPKEIGVDLGDVEENGETFSQNAYIKAKSAFDLLNGEYCVVADDSGLCVDILGGKPGVYSARYGGEGLDDVGRYQKLLSDMKDVPCGKRSAHFACCICAIMTDGKVIEAQGKCDGVIGTEPVGDGGFGYDPIFIVNGKSFSQLTDEEKDLYSHRGNALRLFKKKIETYLEDK